MNALSTEPCFPIAGAVTCSRTSASRHTSFVSITQALSFRSLGVRSPSSSHTSRPKTFSFRGPCAGVQIPRVERQWSWRSARGVVIRRWITFTLFNSNITSPPSHRLMLDKVAVSRRTQYVDAGIEPRPIQPFLSRSPPVGHFQYCAHWPIRRILVYTEGIQKWYSDWSMCNFFYTPELKLIHLPD